MFDSIKADLRFGLYAFANSPMELRIAAECDEAVEDGLMADLEATERTIAAQQARQLRDLARFAAMRPAKPGKPEPFSEFAADEIAVALKWTRRMAQARLELAVTLTKKLPETLAALGRGELDLRRAQALAELTEPLAVETARQVEAAVLPKAPGWNTAQLRRAARRAVVRVDPAGAEQRHKHRKQGRRVEFYPMDDAMAELTAYLPAADAERIHRRLDAFAKAAPPDDDRTMDQRRADAFTDLLLHGAVGADTKADVLVQVTVPATTLLGLDEQPGELAGYGPVPASVARELAADGVWRRLLTDPASGALLDYGRTTYRPPAALADFVRARDQRCVFAGCFRPAADCDLDHGRRYPDGPTSEENLAPLCRHHHVLKHEAGWTLDKVGDRYIWTTPNGYEYVREPEPIAEPAPRPAPPPAPVPRDEPPPF